MQLEYDKQLEDQLASAQLVGLDELAGYSCPGPESGKPEEARCLTLVPSQLSYFIINSYLQVIKVEYDGLEGKANSWSAVAQVLRS